MTDATPPRELTQLLVAWSRGDHQALELPAKTTVRKLTQMVAIARKK